MGIRDVVKQEVAETKEHFGRLYGIASTKGVGAAWNYDKTVTNLRAYLAMCMLGLEKTKTYSERFDELQRSNPELDGMEIRKRLLGPYANSL